MTWSPIPQSGLAIDWNSVFGRSRVDPYLVWADATNFKGLSREPPQFLQIAFELKAHLLQTLGAP